MTTTALTTQQQKALELRDYLNNDRIKSQIAAALPKWLTPDRFLRVIFGAALRNPKIMECSMESILQSVMMCAQLGLEPILGRAHLVPYWNGKKRCLECQFQPGYQGMTDLARRSGMIQDVYAQVVYENDTFEIEYGTSRRLSHKPTLNGDPGKPIGAYAVWEFKDSTKTFEFMPMRDIEKRRAVSQSYNFAETGDPAKGGGKQDSVWHTWLDDQMRKTVVKHSAKLVPLSIEFMETVQVDNAAEIGQRVTMFQGVPMIEGNGGGDRDDGHLFDANPDPWGEQFNNFITDPAFEAFVANIEKSQRCSRAALVKEANSRPDEFIASFHEWCSKQKAAEVQKQRKPRSDKGQPRKPAGSDDVSTPWQQQQPPARGQAPAPEPSFPPEPQGTTTAPPANAWSEEDELRAAKMDLDSYQSEERFRYHVLEAKRRTGISQPQALDGYNRLLDAIREVIAEKAKQ